MQSLWMLFASFMFAIMGVCVKLASDMYSTSEIVMYRGIIGMIVMSCTILYQGGSFKTTMPGQHLWRGVVGVIALWLWFYAIAILPLATAMTLNYMAPIWIAVILLAGGFWKGMKQVEWPLVAAIAMSFVGVTLLLQPVFETDQLAGAITALISGMLSALAYLQVRKLGLLGEPEYRVVFYFSVVNFLAGVIGHVASAGVMPEILRGRPDEARAAQYGRVILATRQGHDDGQVQRIGSDEFLQVKIGAHRHIQAHGGKQVRELRQQGGQARAHEIFRHAEAHGAGNRGTLEAPRQGILRGQDLPRVAQEILAIFRQAQAARGAQQQREARLFFQAADLVADGGLAQVQPFGGARKAARVRYGDQGAQQGGIEVHEAPVIHDKNE